MEYRKRIELDTSTDYWFVELGEMLRLTGDSSWPFPTEAAARKFAVANKRLAKQKYGAERDVRIRFPDGTKEEIGYE
jgi:hypothetical protein